MGRYFPSRVITVPVDRRCDDNVLVLVSVAGLDNVLKNLGKTSTTERTYFPYQLK
jgi:hypothetical protein